MIKKNLDIHRAPVHLAHNEKPSLSSHVLQKGGYDHKLAHKAFFAVEGRAIRKIQCRVYRRLTVSWTFETHDLRKKIFRVDFR